MTISSEKTLTFRLETGDFAQLTRSITDTDGIIAHQLKFVGGFIQVKCPKINCGHSAVKLVAARVANHTAYDA